MTEIPQQPDQLTFDVGGDTPTSAVLRVTGSIHLHRELAKGEEAHVQVVDADGVCVADGYGTVVAVSFRDRRDEHGNVTETERGHTLKVA